MKIHSFISSLVFVVSSHAFAGDFSCFYTEKNGDRTIGAALIKAKIDSALNVTLNKKTFKFSAVFEGDTVISISAENTGEEYHYAGRVTTTMPAGNKLSSPVICSAIAEDL